MLKKKKIYIYIYNIIKIKFWPKFIKKDYLFANFYKKKTLFFSKCLDFFIYIAKK
ncbi:unnamed protein product [Staurois parvus]|uniref:Ribosomal protein L32 n=1 Tax=Staurois parvus TaxID=386267 RepID=A0ABN9FD45_9NEOB|nr:unnamed protein product [Staurois parvus]